MTSNSIIHGIPAYIEPQCLIERGYKRDKTSDIYSFGKSFGKFQTNGDWIKREGNDINSSDNVPTIKGKKRNGDALCNCQTLSTLYISDDRLRLYGSKQLVDILQNTNLKTLKLYRVSFLVDAVRNNTTLTSLDLDDNRLKKSSIETALGKSSKETWAEIYDIIDPLFEGVRTTKKGLFRNDDYYELYRDGNTEEAYFDYTYGPVYKPNGTV
ncbi:hypothetical protein C2G38_2194440 [Gigaspora rosea]|uniref:Uncharacterized protein n=1 Tax=Gigaspora rosea TaxID=44941 RepID=A0A397V0W9_9GLOM|nr:hypothetical protein C2G38_2194440 [Gigaspora rosea]